MAVLPVGFGASGGYTIDRSLRLRSSASAYLTRTLGVNSTSSTICTWSGWIKRGALGTARATVYYQGNAGATGNFFYIEFYYDVLRCIFDGTVTTVLQTSAVYRDPSAWYHVVLAYDSTQATASDRAKLYVNGAQVTAFSTANYPALNQAFTAVSGDYQNLGVVAGLYFDGYMTEVNFIDGQALDASSFGEYNSNTGVWQPIKYVGTYGANGFYLNFSDNSTTTTLGYDYSGNSNNFTANNVSVTSGTTYDSMRDVPTLTSEDAANYAVMNPIDVSPTEYNGRATITNGNLTVTGGNQFARGWKIPSTGKWYWEVTLIDYYYGPPAIWGAHGVSSGLVGNITGVYLYASGGIMQDGTVVQAFGTWATNDVIGLAYDSDTRSMTIYRNGSQVGTSVTANDTEKYIYSFMNGTADTSSGAYNFGQQPFAHTPPTGFKSLNTYNLPDSTIEDGSEYFDVVLRTGTGTADGQSQIISSLAFTPDLVWNKARSLAFNHNLVDSVRGNDALLLSNSTNAETSVGTTGTQLQITANGFTAIQRVSYNATNQNGVTYVAWNWKANGSGVSNTDGSITSTVSANTTAGFSIVTYTGTGANATVGHGLGVAPKVVIVKNRPTAPTNWRVYHENANASPASGNLFLNATNAFFTQAACWNSTAPTSSVFSIGTAIDTNYSGASHIAYCFAAVDSYSSFGAYLGNGSADGPCVFLNFRPAFVLLKASNTVANWVIIDNQRNEYNPAGKWLLPDDPAAEYNYDALYPIDFLSNGFKLRTSVGTLNASGYTYTYMAFAENPFKNALAR